MNTRGNISNFFYQAEVHNINIFGIMAFKKQVQTIPMNVSLIRQNSPALPPQAYPSFS